MSIENSALLVDGEFFEDVAVRDTVHPDWLINLYRIRLNYIKSVDNEIGTIAYMNVCDYCSIRGFRLCQLKRNGKYDGNSMARFNVAQVVLRLEFNFSFSLSYIPPENIGRIFEIPRVVFPAAFLRSRRSHIITLS